MKVLIVDEEVLERVVIVHAAKFVDGLHLLLFIEVAYFGRSPDPKRLAELHRRRFDRFEDWLLGRGGGLHFDENDVMRGLGRCLVGRVWGGHRLCEGLALPVRTGAGIPLVVLRGRRRGGGL